MTRKGDGGKEMDNSSREGLDTPPPWFRFWLLVSYELVGYRKEGSSQALDFISSMWTILKLPPPPFLAPVPHRRAVLG